MLYLCCAVAGGRNRLQNESPGALTPGLGFSARLGCGVFLFYRIAICEVPIRRPSQNSCTV